MPQLKAIADAMTLIFMGREMLAKAFPNSNRSFTPDGRMVGDIGEVLAEMLFGIKLHYPSQHTHDGTAPDGRSIQIKATFKKGFAFRKVPDHFIGFWLNEKRETWAAQGMWKVIYNGPGSLLAPDLEGLEVPGSRQKMLPLARVLDLDRLVADTDRVPPLFDTLLTHSNPSPLWEKK